ncbi:hypothetical protein CTI12_AA557520 [Artemisia annua]|uniref:Transmembrane protein n=1 Tax=Artemisia annua TaxID=35608 RepID=A0A2U1KW69_ARTAN|nr:hypothetical protein CTI12_AA557520 [Artemisia annua]
MGGGTEQDWRKMADTTKMSPEEVKNLGVESSKRPPGHNPGGVLHQHRSMPFSLTTMTVVGFLMAAGIGYGVLYAYKKPEASALDVAKVTAGVADASNTHPRPKPRTQPEDTSPRN